MSPGPLLAALLRMFRQRRAWVPVLALAGSVVVLTLVFRRLDPQALREGWRRLDPAWYLLAHLVFGLATLFSGLRWHILLRLARLAVHGVASVRLVAISHFFATALVGSSSADVVKSALYARWYRFPVASVWAGSVLDRMTAGVGGLLFGASAMGLGWWSGGFGVLREIHWREFPSRLPALTGGVVAAALLVAAGAVAWVRLARPGSFLERWRRSLRESGGRLFTAPRLATPALAASIGSAALFNIAQLCCLQAVSEEPVAWGRLLWMQYLITACAALPVSMAGAGLREAASMLLLGQAGISPATAVSASLLTLSIHATWAVGGALGWAREEHVRRRVPKRATVVSLAAVIPTRNEARNLGETVRRIRANPEFTEILVVDGGSTDDTVEQAVRLGCRVVSTGRGRGLQQREGARVATADAVVFVHADVWLPADAGQAILSCLRDDTVVGGGLWKRFADAPWPMRGARLRCGLRLWTAGNVLGDQALFVRRDVLQEVGGVPDQPLMEEVELCRRLGREGRLALAGATVAASARRFRERGVWRTYWRMWRVSWAHWRGVPPAELARMYDRP